MEIRTSADKSKGQISADNIGGPTYRSVSNMYSIFSKMLLISCFRQLLGLPTAFIWVEHSTNIIFVFIFYKFASNFVSMAFNENLYKINKL